MRSATRLLQSCRITLFTRPNCSLCTDARQVLATVWDKKPFAYKEVNVMKPEAKDWRDIYEFDAPVIHISRSDAGAEKQALAGKAVKLMHRFTLEEVVKKMERIAGNRI